MARFFITGSSDGLGLLTAQRLVAAGYRLVLHARNIQRAAETKMACPGAEAVLVADLTSIEETKQLAAEANAMCEKDAGRNSEAWDEDDGYAAVIHNAGVYSAMEGVPGKSGLPSLFSVNVLAPYVLTCLMAATRSSNPPKRLIYVSSGLHRSGSSAALRPGRLEHCSYSDSKLADVMLAKAFARRLQKPEDLVCSSVDPDGSRLRWVGGARRVTSMPPWTRTSCLLWARVMRLRHHPAPTFTTARSHGQRRLLTMLGRRSRCWRSCKG